MNDNDILDALDEKIEEAPPHERQRLILEREKAQERQFKKSIARRARLNRAKP